MIGQKSCFNHMIRPICPTRWLCRNENIRRLLGQYPSTLQVLKEMNSLNSSDPAYKAVILKKYFLQGQAFLAAKIAQKVFGILEESNVIVQRRSMSVCGMVEAVNIVNARLETLQSSEEFEILFNKTKKAIDNNSLLLLKLPRTHNPPSWYTRQAIPHTHDSAESYYCQIYFEIIDQAKTELRKRYKFDEGGLKECASLEAALLANDDLSVLQKYPQINVECLKIQLPMFKLQYKDCSTIKYVIATVRIMVPEVKSIFSEIIAVIRLFFIFPVSSCKSERSFSCLRRLKTWLRSTMTHQERLNAATLCHIYKDVLDQIDLLQIARKFSSKTPVRRNCFGHF